MGGVTPSLATSGLTHSSGLPTQQDCGSSVLVVVLEIDDKDNNTMIRFFLKTIIIKKGKGNPNQQSFAKVSLTKGPL